MHWVDDQETCLFSFFPFFFKPRSATAFASDFEHVISPKISIYSQNTTATTTNLLGDASWTYGCEALFLS